MKKSIPTPMEKVWLSFTGEKVAQEITNQLQVLLHDTILDHLRRRSVVTLHDLEEAGMPNVTLRLATVKLFFDGMRSMVHSFADSILDAVDLGRWVSEADKLRFVSSIVFQELSAVAQGQSDETTQEEAKQRLAQLKKEYFDLVDRGPYKEGLQEMGARVGWSFALNLIDYARRSREEIPLTYDKLLEFWSIFDSATDIADSIAVDIADPQDMSVAVTVQESFLVRGRVQDQYQHVHCPFIEGYVLGVIDGLFLNWNHWISTQVFRSPDHHLRVKSVQEVDKTSARCYLRIDLYEESKELRRPAIRLADAALNLENGLVKEAIVNTRGALEECLLVGMGLSSNVQIKFASFIEQAEKVGIKLSHKRFLDLYSELSSIVHSEGDVPEARAHPLLAETWLLTREIPAEFSAEDKLKMNDQRKWFVQSRPK